MQSLIYHSPLNIIRTPQIQQDDSKNSSLRHLWRRLERSLTHTLGENDHGSAQNGRTSGEMWSPIHHKQ